MIYTLFATVGFFIFILTRNSKLEKLKGSLEPGTKWGKKQVKDPYNPVELGINNWFKRRWPDFFKRGNVVGDVSPLNPIPFRSVVEDRKKLYDGIWGHVDMSSNAKKQFELVKEKMVYDETHGLLDTMNRLPQGKKRWAKDASNYGVFSVQ